MSEAVEKVQAQMPEMLPRGEQDVDRERPWSICFFMALHISHAAKVKPLSLPFTHGRAREKDTVAMTKKSIKRLSCCAETLRRAAALRWRSEYSMFACDRGKFEGITDLFPKQYY